VVEFVVEVGGLCDWLVVFVVCGECFDGLVCGFGVVVLVWLVDGECY